MSLSAISHLYTRAFYKADRAYFCSQFVSALLQTVLAHAVIEIGQQQDAYSHQRQRAQQEMLCTAWGRWHPYSLSVRDMQTIKHEESALATVLTIPRRDRQKTSQRVFLEQTHIKSSI